VDLLNVLTCLISALLIHTNTTFLIASLSVSSLAKFFWYSNLPKVKQFLIMWLLSHRIFFITSERCRYKTCWLNKWNYFVLKKSHHESVMICFIYCK